LPTALIACIKMCKLTIGSTHRDLKLLTSKTLNTLSRRLSLLPKHLKSQETKDKKSDPRQQILTALSVTDCPIPMQAILAADPTSHRRRAASLDATRGPISPRYQKSVCTVSFHPILDVIHQNCPKQNSTIVGLHCVKSKLVPSPLMHRQLAPQNRPPSGSSPITKKSGSLHRHDETNCWWLGSPPPPPWSINEGNILFSSSKSLSLCP
jgi:hypothetical protein